MELPIYTTWIYVDYLTLFYTPACSTVYRILFCVFFTSIHAFGSLLRFRWNTYLRCTVHCCSERSLPGDLPTDYPTTLRWCVVTTVDYYPSRWIRCSVYHIFTTLFYTRIRFTLRGSYDLLYFTLLTVYVSTDLVTTPTTYPLPTPTPTLIYTFVRFQFTFCPVVRSPFPTPLGLPLTRADFPHHTTVPRSRPHAAFTARPTTDSCRSVDIRYRFMFHI